MGGVTINAQFVGQVSYAGLWNLSAIFSDVETNFIWVRSWWFFRSEDPTISMYLGYNYTLEVASVIKEYSKKELGIGVDVPEQ